MHRPQGVSLPIAAGWGCGGQPAPGRDGPGPLGPCPVGPAHKLFVALKTLKILVKNARARYGFWKPRQYWLSGEFVHVKPRIGAHVKPRANSQAECM